MVDRVVASVRNVIVLANVKVDPVAVSVEVFDVDTIVRDASI